MYVKISFAHGVVYEFSDLAIVDVDRIRRWLNYESHGHILHLKYGGCSYHLNREYVCAVQIREADISGRTVQSAPNSD